MTYFEYFAGEKHVLGNVYNPAELQFTVNPPPINCVQYELAGIVLNKLQLQIFNHLNNDKYSITKTQAVGIAS